MPFKGWFVQSATMILLCTEVEDTSIATAESQVTTSSVRPEWSDSFNETGFPAATLNPFIRAGLKFFFVTVIE